MLKPHSSITATHCTPLLGVPEYKSDAAIDDEDDDQPDE